MATELIYTSAERGLRGGSQGFCTVLMTNGLPLNLVERLESLSGYRTPTGQLLAHALPVNYQHLRFSVGGQDCSILSRVCDSGVDYTGRSNKLAHHLVISDTLERFAAGAAAILATPGLFRSAWAEEPSVQPPVKLRTPSSPGFAMTSWRRVLGDPGWAGAIAQHTLSSPDAIVAFVYGVNTTSDSLLELFSEALQLLPKDKRWDVTFSTYLTDMPLVSSCRWRGVLRGSSEHKKAQRHPAALIIDLDHVPQLSASGMLVTCAREGREAFPAIQSTRESDSLVTPDIGYSMKSPSRRPVSYGDIGRRPRIRVKDAGPSTRKLVAIGAACLLFICFCGILIFRWTFSAPQPDVSFAQASAVAANAAEDAPPAASSAPKKDESAQSIEKPATSEHPKTESPATEESAKSEQVAAETPATDGEEAATQPKSSPPPAEGPNPPVQADSDGSGTGDPVQQGSTTPGNDIGEQPLTVETPTTEAPEEPSDGSIPLTATIRSLASLKGALEPLGYNFRIRVHPDFSRKTTPTPAVALSPKPSLSQTSVQAALKISSRDSVLRVTHSVGANDRNFIEILFGKDGRPQITLVGDTPLATAILRDFTFTLTDSNDHKFEFWMAGDQEYALDVARAEAELDVMESQVNEQRNLSSELQQKIKDGEGRLKQLREHRPKVVDSLEQHNKDLAALDQQIGELKNQLREVDRMKDEIVEKAAIASEHVNNLKKCRIALQTILSTAK